MRTWAVGLLALGLAAGAGGGGGMARGDIGASATYTSGPGSSQADKIDLTLHNTGDKPISVFWYAWDDSELNFLPFIPANMQAPANWFPLVTYGYVPSAANYTYGIEWYTFSAPLASGDSLDGFSFESNLPASFFSSISTVPPVNPGDLPFNVGTSFVYMNYPAQGAGDGGFQFVAVPAPEPASLGLVGCAMGLAALRRRRN